MSNTFKGKLFLIVGPSGVGKSVVIDLLKKNHPEFVFPITATTRIPRPTEKDCVHYYFLDKTEFEKKIENGDFLEYAIVHGDNYYGVLKESVLPALEEGRTVVREVDIQGAKTIHQKFDGDHLVSVFLLPPPREVLIERIRSRAPISDEELEERLESLEQEVSHADSCSYQLKFDGTIEENYQKLEGLILSLIG